MIIVIQIRDDFLSKIDVITWTYYLNKVKISEAIENKKTDSPLLYELSEVPSEVFSSESMYIEKMMLYIRSNQDILYRLLTSCKTSSSKATLSSFVVNFLYSNIFSSESIDEELLLFLYRSLKFEIEKLNKTFEPECFLSEEKGTINSYLLSNLIRNDDIKVYFNKILASTISKIDGQEENKLLTLDPLIITKNIQNQKSKKGSKSQLGLNDNDLRKVFRARETISNDTFMTSDSENSHLSQEVAVLEGLSGMSKEMFFSTYIPDFGKDDIRTAMSKQTNQQMNEYLFKQLSELKNKKETYFSNVDMINNVYQSKDATDVLDNFYINFSNIVDIISELFNNLCANIEIIPNSLRYISKIIALLIKKKFPNIVQVELNGFIAQFFFEKILKPIFTMADYSGLLKSTILLSNTKDNIKLIHKIIQKLVGGSFFNCNKDPNFTILNRFFIQIMPKVLDFFEKLIDVELPPFIEKIVQNTAGEDFIENCPLFLYQYDYFKENPEELLRDISICYNVEDILAILDIIKNNQKLMFAKNQFTNEKEFNNFKMAYDKLIMNEHMRKLIEVKNTDSKEKQKRYVLIKKREHSKIFSEIMEYKNQHFQFQEIKTPKDDKEKEQNTMYKVKNALCKILFNFKSIPKKNFFGYKVNSTEDFLSALSKLAKITYCNLDTSVESDWFILSLKSYITKLPKKYLEDDYSLFYRELENDIKTVVDRIEGTSMGEVIDSLRWADNNMKLTEKNVRDLEQIELNNKIQTFLNTSVIESTMSFVQTKESSKFIIKSNKGSSNNKFKYLDDFLFEKKKDYGVVCKNIFQFTKSFPHLEKIEHEHPGQLIEYEQKFEVPKALYSYFATVKSSIEDFELFFEEKNKKKDKNEEVKQKKVDKAQKKQEDKEKKNYIVMSVYEIVTNYIMNRIYDKVFPHEQDQNDYLIYQQCLKLSWVEPNNMVSIPNLNLDNILPRTVGLIKEMDFEKSPEGKLRLVSKVIQIILNNSTYCLGSKIEGGMDDQVPMLIYVIIKAQPFRFSSNIDYLDLFLGGKDSGYGQGKQVIGMLQGIRDWILNVTCKKLGVTEQEFTE